MCCRKRYTNLPDCVVVADIGLRVVVVVAVVVVGGGRVEDNVVGGDVVGGGAVYGPLIKFNPLLMSGLSHNYHLDKSTFIFRDIRNHLSFFNEIQVITSNTNG